MRCVFCTLIVCLLAGCRNQSLPLSNPFSAPNRVPPPATRTLLPGTAQPYYPGDPVPNSPAIGIPASTYQTPTYGPAPTYSPQPTAPSTPTNPPGGWNAYPQSRPVSSVPNGNNVRQVSADVSLGSARGESVQVPTDNASLRFAQSPPTQSPQLVGAPVAPANYAAAQSTARQAPQFTDWQNPVTPTQFVQQPPVARQRQVSIREVSTSELPYVDARSSPARRVGRDGFRPQGSSRTARDQAQAVIRPTEPATTGRKFAPVEFASVNEAAERFGFDPRYQWLRGQLQRSPTTGQWQLRYVPHGGSPDQFGGTVLVANPQVLGNLQPGEHVSVQGRLEMVQLDAQSAIPAYTISVLQRQQQDLR